MKRSRNPFRLLGALALLVALGAGLLSSVAAQDATPVAGVKIDNVALISPSARTNLGWDQQAADAIDAVAAKLGITATVQENGGYDDITPALKDLASGGAQLIICHASGYASTCADFANAEKVPVAVVEAPDTIVPGLISSTVTQGQEVAYLAGLLSGKSTKTGTVGVVVSGEPPTWNYMTAGFAEGLKAGNADAKMLYSVIGEAAYDDAAGAKRVTEQQLAAGADIIFGQGDGASFGMIEAIREFNAKPENADKQAKFIDVIGDKSKDYSDVLLTSVVFDYEGTYEQMIKDLEAGTFGKEYVMDVKNGGVRLLDLPDSVDQSTRDAVDAAKQDIVDGKIKVSAIGDAEALKARLKELGLA